jgi:hypothetical protein
MVRARVRVTAELEDLLARAAERAYMRDLRQMIPADTDEQNALGWSDWQFLRVHPDGELTYTYRDIELDSAVHTGENWEW